MPLEIIVGAAVGAAVASPTIRKQLRKGLVYSLAGALIAYDKVAGLAHEARSRIRGGADADDATPSETAATVPSASAPVTSPAEPVVVAVTGAAPAAPVVVNH